MIEKLKKIRKKPKSVLFLIMNLKLLKYLPDIPYLKLKYRLIMDKKLDLNNPKTYNEKLQWLKLYDRNRQYSRLVDKYEVRSYVSELIGEEYLIPLLGVYESFEEIDFNKLPNQFVLKPNHTSGNVFICKDKSEINYSQLKKKINSWLKREYYWLHREWPYKNVKPKIIIEKYMVDETGTELKDYKFYCFNGEPRIIQVDFNRFIEHKRNFYDIDWNYKDISLKYPNDPNSIIKKPIKIKEMNELARTLAKDYAHVRVDFYSINRNIYFGEMTFYSEAGFGKFQPSVLDKEIGSWINITELQNPSIKKTH